MTMYEWPDHAEFRVRIARADDDIAVHRSNRTLVDAVADALRRDFDGCQVELAELEPAADPLPIRCGACLATSDEQCRSVSTGQPRPRVHRFRILQGADLLVPCGRCDAFGWEAAEGVTDEMQVPCGSCGAPAGSACRGVTELHYLRTRQVELGLAPCGRCDGRGWEPAAASPSGEVPGDLDTGDALQRLKAHITTASHGEPASLDDAALCGNPKTFRDCVCGWREEFSLKIPPREVLAVLLAHQRECEEYQRHKESQRKMEDAR